MLNQGSTLCRSADEVHESGDAHISDEDDNASGSWLVDKEAETTLPGGCANVVSPAAVHVLGIPNPAHQADKHT